LPAAATAASRYAIGNPAFTEKTAAQIEQRRKKAKCKAHA
jgi:hypothetical protein